MKNLPLISICVPAYKRLNYLERLLNSIAIQNYKNFEVIVSDDTNDLSVFHLTQSFKDKFNLKYKKNSPALGTPANWNAAIAMASGEWIKIMHDDDWFVSAESLEIFAKHTDGNNKFIFSAYINCFEVEGRKPEQVFMRRYWRNKIIREPNILWSENFIGPPSVTLLHSSLKLKYDERLKWRVDMEYYIRVLLQEKIYKYIDRPLVNIGISESQVTQYCIYNPSVELPEGFILLENHGVRAFRNVWVYDAWWRLLRNMNIRSEEQLNIYVNKQWPLIILKMINDLNAVPQFLLKNGVTSKSLMTLSYLKNRSAAN